MIGKTLGQYRVVAQIGAGGMGVVYRATDTRLGREVALKALPETLSRDEHRKARFAREAQLLAALNHPNIAAVYGLEESPSGLVIAMELVRGTSLAERLRGGPIPMDEALSIARQVAEGLAAAHEKGIIHRDLKPANVNVEPDGRVKLLDFGLAKAVVDEASANDIVSSPTISEIMSRTGVILGTAAYMSPEQARGKELDRRTDIWSFGCLLYEMLTGRMAFGGDTVSDTIARILEREPDLALLPEKTPAAIIRLLRRCLQKDPQRRLRDVADARMEIEEGLSPAGVVAGPMSPAVPTGLGGKQRLWMGAASLLLLLSVLLGWWGLRRGAAVPQALVRLQAATPQLSLETECTIDISRDGSRIAYVGEQDGKRQIYVRPLDAASAKPIPGTEGGWCPFFSPDGRWLAFWGDQKLKKISLSGGSATGLYDVPVDLWSAQLKASWAADDSVVFAALRAGGRGVLERVRPGGGAPERLVDADTKAEEYYLFQPELLPGGEAILFTAAKPSSEPLGVAVQSLKTGQRKTLVEGAYGAHYVPTGHLLYMQAGKLMAAPFDAKGLRVTGLAVEMADDLSTWSRPNGADYAVSENGTLVYLPPVRANLDQTLVWVDRQGHEQAVTEVRKFFFGPQISPDGKKISIWLANDQQVWVLDIERGLLTRTTTQNQNFWNIWSPDGRQIIFNSVRPDSPGTSLFRQSWDGTGTPERLTTTDLLQQPRSFTRDGKLLVFQEQGRDTGYDIWVLPMEQGAKARPLLRTPFNEYQPKLSPDGRWMAYVSNESGRDEIYVRPFPAMDQKWLISNDGGLEPLWAPDGRELFYRKTSSPTRGSTLIAVAISTAQGFHPGKPTKLFEGPYLIAPVFGQNYDIAPNGKRFVMVKIDPVTSPKAINVVLNWFEELKRRVPAGR